MRVYTSLNARAITETLHRSKSAGLVGSGIYLLEFNEYPRKRLKGVNPHHPNRFSIRLGSHDQTGIPAGSLDSQGKTMHLRRSWNTGYSLGYYDHVYAATWDEWGWFLAYLFGQDPNAVCGWYKGRTDFNVKTDFRYVGDPGDIRIPTKPANQPKLACTCIIGNMSGGITTSVMNCAYHSKNKIRLEMDKRTGV